MPSTANQTSHCRESDLNSQFNGGWINLSRSTRLDREADIELAHGHIAAAERLARIAASLREAGR